MFKGGDHAFATIKAEALGAGIFDIEELLEVFACNQLGQNGFLALRCEADFLVFAFNALLQPGFLFGVGDMHELHTQGAAIGALQDFDDLAYRCFFKAQHIVEKDRAIKVGCGEAIGFRIELWMACGFFEFQWIKVGCQVTPHAIGADHHQGAHRIHGGFLDFICRRGAGNGNSGNRGGFCSFWHCCRQLGRNGVFDLDPIAV